MKNKIEFTKATTVGELRKMNYAYKTVKQEMRDNLINKIKQGEAILPGIYGYENTVEKQIINAILSKHNFILLGLRGQGKTKIIRSLVHLLDEEVPVIAGSLLNEHPLAPISLKYHKMEQKNKNNKEYKKTQSYEILDEIPIRWIKREERFNEKLATPDVSIADLLGDIDPIKAAREKLDISNEEIIHWGIIPRSNRGIFAINELPDLQPRIQVGLFNILEEQDIQIRGFPLRIPLDLLLVFSANPEDYTNRGRIITPLKDRIESQIITHYPRERTIAKEITRSQIDPQVTHGIWYSELVLDIVEQITIEARTSELSDAMSGVSQRLSIAALENICANTLRRHLNCIQDKKTTKIKPSTNEVFAVRVIDLYGAVAAITGKVELIEERRTEEIEQIAGVLINKAISKIVKEYLPNLYEEKQFQSSQSSKYVENQLNDKGDEEEVNFSLVEYNSIISYFKDGNSVILEEKMSDEELANALNVIPGLHSLVNKYFIKKNKVEEKDKLFFQELVLEFLHEQSFISRKVIDGTITFVDIYGSMFKNL